MTLSLNAQSTNFSIDTGTVVTVISEKDYTKIGIPELKILDMTLKGPSNNQPACKG